MIRATAVTIVELLLFGACLFGAAGSLSWPMAWAVLAIYSLPKAAAFAFLDPELLRERTAPGPGVDRGDVVLAALGSLALYPVMFVVAGLDAVRFALPSRFRNPFRWRRAIASIRRGFVGACCRASGSQTPAAQPGLESDISQLAVPGFGSLLASILSGVAMPVIGWLAQLEPRSVGRRRLILRIQHGI